MPVKREWLVLWSEKKNDFVAMENKKPWQRTPKTVAGMHVVGLPYARTPEEAIDWVKGCQK
jgi:hypothetical protein